MHNALDVVNSPQTVTMREGPGEEVSDNRTEGENRKLIETRMSWRADNQIFGPAL